MAYDLEQRILGLLHPEPLTIHQLWDILGCPWEALTGSLASLQRDRRIKIDTRPVGFLCTRTELQRKPEAIQGCPFDESFRRGG